MKMKELKEKKYPELNNLLREKRESLRKARFDLTSGKLKNYREIKGVKKDIARILTLMRKKKKV